MVGGPKVDFGLPQLVLLPPGPSSGVPLPPRRRQHPLPAPPAPLPDFVFFNDLLSREPLFIKALPSLPSLPSPSAFPPSPLVNPRQLNEGPLRPLAWERLFHHKDRRLAIFSWISETSTLLLFFFPLKKSSNTRRSRSKVGQMAKD